MKHHMVHKSSQSTDIGPGFNTHGIRIGTWDTMRVIATAAVWIAVLSAANSPVAWSQLPIVESFKNATAPGWTIGGSAGLTSGGSDPTGNGWLRLTSNGTNQAGCAYYSTAFSSVNGVYISFDFTAWGGSGADGISFLLFNGSTASPIVGAPGGSLGYAQKKGPSIPGFTNGYVGIGLDEFGNFSNPSEGRNGGPGSRPDAVAIRGVGNDTSGYWYLSGSGTIAQGIDITGRSSRPGQTGTSYRNVIMYILPTGETSVLLKFGATSAYSTVVNQFNITTMPGQGSLPASFKIALAASTGASTNFHEVRNLSVREPTDLVSSTSGFPGVINPGQNISFTVTYANNGPNAAHNAVLFDSLNTALSGISWSCAASGGAVCPTFTFVNGALIATAGTFPAGGSIAVTISGTVGASPPAQVRNITNITPPALAGDINPANNSAISTSTFSLPVELTAFSAERHADAVLLQWTTRTESNNYGFGIERRIDAETAPPSDWERLGFVDGNGSSDAPHQYHFSDVSAPAGALAYRLRQIDRDGRVTCHGPVMIAPTQMPAVSVQLSPSPCGGRCGLNYTLPEAGRVRIRLYRADGRFARELCDAEQSAGPQQLSLDAVGLDAGLYFARLSTARSTTIHKVLIVQ